ALVKKLLLISLISTLGVSGFSIAVSVGIGFNLDMSSGSVVTPFFLQFAVGVPLIRGVIHSYIFSFNWSSLVVKGFSIPEHTYLGLQTRIPIYKSLYVKGELFCSLNHISAVGGGDRAIAGTPLYSRIGFGSYFSKVGLDGGFDGYWQLDPVSTVPFARPSISVDYTF
ncbi:MAG: hypothetical protein ACP5FY_05430, partial [Kosmotogaceae bacterium]